MSWLTSPLATLGRRLFPGLAVRLAVIEEAVVGIPTQLHTMETNMAAREDAAYEKLNADIQTVKDGWASLVTERDQYKAALEQADADKAAAVQAALDDDSDHDAGKIEAADTALAELIPASPVDPEPTPDEPPVDES